MNREIKFRALIKDSKKWAYGDLLINSGNPIIVNQVNRDYIKKTSITSGYHWAIQTPAYFVKKETLGQFTGFKDKNSKEIYEGDILSDLVKTDEGIIQSNQQVFFDQETGSWHLDLSSKQDKSYSNELWLELKNFEYEVTENVHENKINE